MKTFNRFCYGISSKISKNEHVFMIDFDGISFKRVISELLHIQFDNQLSDIYVIRSTNGYNAICLDKLTLNMIYNIGINSKIADQDFFKYGFKREYFVLRFDKDKELICTLKSNSDKYEKSFAHYNFLNMSFGIEKQLDFTFDSNTVIDIIQYPSNKNGYHYVKEVVIND